MLHNLKIFKWIFFSLIFDISVQRYIQWINYLNLMGLSCLDELNRS